MDGHLAPGSGCGSAVHHASPRLQEPELVVYLQQLEGASAAEVLRVGRFDIRVLALPLQPALLGGSFPFLLLH